jgi:PAS domain-containing protein
MALSTRHVLYHYLSKEYKTPVIVVDRSGRCAWANSAYLELTNRRLEEVLNVNWETTVCPEDRDSVKEEWYNACEDGRSFEISYRLSNKLVGDNLVKCIVYGDTHTGYVGFVEKTSPAAEILP